MTERLLSKSRFKLASECAAKLFYTGKPEFADNRLDNSFLKELAKGGFQVGELAKFHFPGGHTVEALDAEQALEETNALLAQNEVTIFEAAFRFEDFFVRVDVLRKKGNSIDLVEVKSKGFHPEGHSFFGKRGGLDSTWRPYLEDIAFQTFVVRKALPDCLVSPFLMLVNKAARASTEGLSQRFLVRHAEGRAKTYVRQDTTEADICRNILEAVSVDTEVNHILEGFPSAKTGKPTEETLEARAQRFAAAYKADVRLPVDISCSPCKGCEFRAGTSDLDAGLKSGFEECWGTRLAALSHTLRHQRPIIDIWRLHHTRKERLIAEGKFFLSDVTEEDLGVKADEKSGLSQSQRQWLQVQSASTGEAFVDAEGLRAAMNTWEFPLHFIDFETCMAALPFHKGRRPFEQIAFQFSHHILYPDGHLEHASQFLRAEPGEFPNVAFARALKNALGSRGTVFRYSHHENSVLCQIYDGLQNDDAVPDREELKAFIQTLTISRDEERGLWEGPRAMVDLCELWMRYVYLPATGGSNSIKKVLPAVLAESTPSLQRFRSPVYGAPGGIKSLNFTNWTWLTTKNGAVVDPYAQLPPVFEGLTSEDLAKLDLLCEGELADGGAAMSAYSMLQFTEMSDTERQKTKQALLTRIRHEG